MTFNELNLSPEIEKAIALCGYTTPTPVQAQAIPAILSGSDVVASAQTGTGKTAAFVLPALHHLATQKANKKTRILVLTPTRELANQITKAAAQYGKFLRFNIVNLVGGMPYHRQIQELSRGADIIVATPGRLLDHIEQRRVNLSGIDMLVLDEADRMLDMGFIEDVEYIAKLTPENRQTLLFSATVDKQLMTVVRHLLKNPVRVDVSPNKISAPLIEQHFYKATNPQNKVRLLIHLLSDNQIFKAIIFTATKAYADKIADRLCDEGFKASALHGDLRQNVRNRTIDQLKQGRIQFLVATDVAARGIDISDITHVFNFDLPRTSEDYVHRIGRTGRAGKTGTAISFALPTDTRQLKNIERYTGQRIHAIAHPDMTAHAYDAPTTQQPSFNKAQRNNDDARSSHAPRRRDRDDRHAPEKSFRSSPHQGNKGRKQYDDGVEKPYRHQNGRDKDKAFVKKSIRSHQNSEHQDGSRPYRRRDSETNTQKSFRQRQDSERLHHSKPYQRRDDDAVGNKKPFRQQQGNRRRPIDESHPQRRDDGNSPKISFRQRSNQRSDEDGPRRERRDHGGPAKKPFRQKQEGGRFASRSDKPTSRVGRGKPHAAGKKPWQGKKRSSSSRGRDAR